MHDEKILPNSPAALRLHFEERAARYTREEKIIRRTIRAFDNLVTRGYSRARFQIMRQRFLEEVGQYLPESGRVLDVGCGFGLFSLYYAQIFPDLRLYGMDLNPKRIAQARRAAAVLGVTNATYEEGDARTFQCDEQYEGAYLLDIIHHIPEAAVRPLLTQLYQNLRPGGTLIIKDVDTHPAYKRWFTFALDKLIDPHSPVHYWSAEDLSRLLFSLGFEVHRHAMVDYLPYPHMLYICRRGK